MENGKITTIIVEDQRMGIDLIRHCLDKRFEVKATCQTIKEAWQAFETHQPDAVILDIELPDGSGLDLAERMLRAKPGLRVLGVSGSTDEYTLYQVFMQGFFGFVDKNQDGVVELRNAIDNLAKGNCYYAAVIHQNMLLMKADPKAFTKLLTEREQQLMCYLGVGASNEYIAERMSLRPVSVQNHRARIMKKLGLKSSVELIQYAINKGFVNLSTIRTSTNEQ
jgi:DNA-binding NarL/FixJ family response regulator